MDRFACSEGVEKRPAVVDGGTRRRPSRELLLRRGGCPAAYAGKMASYSKGRRGWKALQLGHATDGAWTRHDGPYWRRRAAQTGATGRPAIGQGEVEVAPLRDEELVALIGGRPLPPAVQTSTGSVRRVRHPGHSGRGPSRRAASGRAASGGCVSRAGARAGGMARRGRGAAGRNVSLCPCSNA
jgi:hypothetical protein